MKVEIQLEPIGKKIIVNKGTPLRDVLFSYGVEFPCGGKGTCGNCKIQLLKGDIPLTNKHREALKRNNLSEKWRLACLSKAEIDLSIEIAQWESIILADTSRFDFIPQQGYGVAIDVGTTTLVAQLVELKNANVLAAQTRLNPQARFGSDVISRIEFALEKENAQQLKVLIQQEIGLMLQQLLDEHNVEVTKIILVGNAVMHHLFAGHNIAPLSVYPFESKHNGEQNFRAKELNWPVPDNTEIRFMPSIGGFVGSDILAGIIASQMHTAEKPIVLVDLGTNGEIVAGNKDRLLCASTAAGPAFEGNNISCGMRAATGAISSVWANDTQFHYHVIGKDIPRGICGSGLIDAMAVALDKGFVDIGGGMTLDNATIPIVDDIELNQKDVREFQLAKGAVAAGINILLSELSIEYDDIDKVYIAGAFGNFISVSNVVRTGLLEFPVSKINKLGNSALTGAKILLFDQNKAYNDILTTCTHISLESNTNFQNIFAEKMIFQ